MDSMYDTAVAYRESGLSFFPTVDKKPAYRMLPKRYDPQEGREKHSWIPFQEAQPTPEQVDFWYKTGRAKELAFACGPASNGHHEGAGLFIVDVDRPELIPRFREACGTAWDKVAHERTRRGGLHLPMYCDGAAELRNMKLAMRPNPAYVSRAETPKESRYLCDIETRGNGGYACAWPTPNYVLEQGSYFDLSYVEMDEVVYPIIHAAMSFNQVAVDPSFYAIHKAYTKNADLSIPMQIIRAWRDKYTAVSMLPGYGYTQVGRRWRRPGGKSGSLLPSDDGSIVVAFSSNDPLSQLNAAGRPVHDSFGIYMIYEHNSDMRSALAGAAHHLGIAYRRNDYSEQREHTQTRAVDEITFWDGDPGNETLFLVDDLPSAQILRGQGVAVLFIPSGTTNIGAWTTCVGSFATRYAWFSPENLSGATDMIALTTQTPVLPAILSAAELWHTYYQHDEDRFIQNVVNQTKRARIPSLEVKCGDFV